MVGAPEKPLELPVFPLLLGTFGLKSTILYIHFFNIDMYVKYNVCNRKEASGGERDRRGEGDTRDG